MSAEESPTKTPPITAEEKRLTPPVGSTTTPTVQKTPEEEKEVQHRQQEETKGGVEETQQQSDDIHQKGGSEKEQERETIKLATTEKAVESSGEVSVLQLSDEQDQALQEAFEAFASFGHNTHQVEMDNSHFAKLCKECGLIDKKYFNSVDVDMTFTKIKSHGGRKISFLDFRDGIIPKMAIKMKKINVSAQEIAEKVITTGGPKSSGTKAEYNKFFDEKSSYTGVELHEGVEEVAGSSSQKRTTYRKHIAPKYEPVYPVYHRDAINSKTLLPSAMRVHPKGFRILSNASPLERRMNTYFRLPPHPPKHITTEQRLITKTLQILEREETKNISQRQKDGIILDGFMLMDATKVQHPGQATECVINDSNVVSAVAEDLSYFTGLKTLDLGENNIPLHELQGLSNLEELHLHCNTIREIFLPSMVISDGASFLPRLQTLNLSFNQLTPDQLENLSILPSLQRLDLSFNNLRTLPRSLACLHSVTQLALENNKFSKGDVFMALSTMPLLTEVNLNFNQLQSFPKVPAGGFPCLEILGVASNEIVYFEDVYSLTQLPKLRTVVLWGNPIQERRKDTEILQYEFGSLDIVIVLDGPVPPRRKMGDFYAANTGNFVQVSEFKKLKASGKKKGVAKKAKPSMEETTTIPPGDDFFVTQPKLSTQQQPPLNVHVSAGGGGDFPMEGSSNNSTPAQRNNKEPVSLTTVPPPHSNNNNPFGPSWLSSGGNGVAGGGNWEEIKAPDPSSTGLGEGQAYTLGTVQARANRRISSREGQEHPHHMTTSSGFSGSLGSGSKNAEESGGNRSGGGYKEFWQSSDMFLRQAEKQEFEDARRKEMMLRGGAQVPNDNTQQGGFFFSSASPERSGAGAYHADSVVQPRTNMRTAMTELKRMLRKPLPPLNQRNFDKGKQSLDSA